jgi:hypothetical protein
MELWELHSPTIPWPRPDLIELSTKASVTELIQRRSPVTFLSRQGWPLFHYSNWEAKFNI